MNTETKNAYLCYTCGEPYLTKNAADRCNQLPKEELKFSMGSYVLVDACRSTERTGTVVGIKYVAGFSGGKHFVSYTVELPDKSLVLRNARSLKLYTHMAHPNKQEILAGIAAGRKWEFRGAEMDEWLSSPWHLKSPSWLPNHEYRLKPEPEYVPLGPEDVPPGTVLRGAGEVDFKGWCMITSCSETGIRLWSHCDSDGKEITWKSVKDNNCQINRSIPLTGKWNPNAWKPCKKLKQ